MPKINMRYQSVLAYMETNNYPLAGRINKFLNPDEQPIQERYITINTEDRYTQLFGALQPLEDMAKDFSNIKPYKSWAYVRRDLLSPLYGVGNIIKGLATLVGATALFFINLGKAFFAGSRAGFMDQMRTNFYNTASWLVNGMLNIVRGITQFGAVIYTTIKAAVRSRKAFPTLTENAGVKRLVSEGEGLMKALGADENKSETVQKLIRAKLTTLLHALDRKFKKAEKNGQQIFTFIGQGTKLTTEEAEQLEKAKIEKDKLLKSALVANAGENDILNYLYLFRSETVEHSMDAALILKVIKPDVVQKFDSAPKPQRAKSDYNFVMKATANGVGMAYTSANGVFAVKKKSARPCSILSSVDDTDIHSDTTALKPRGFAAFD